MSEFFLERTLLAMKGYFRLLSRLLLDRLMDYLRCSAIKIINAD